MAHITCATIVAHICDTPIYLTNTRVHMRVAYYVKCSICLFHTFHACINANMYYIKHMRKNYSVGRSERLSSYSSAVAKVLFNLDGYL